MEQSPLFIIPQRRAVEGRNCRHLAPEQSGAWKHFARFVYVSVMSRENGGLISAESCQVLHSSELDLCPTEAHESQIISQLASK